MYFKKIYIRTALMARVISNAVIVKYENVTNIRKRYLVNKFVCIRYGFIVGTPG